MSAGKGKGPDKGVDWKKQRDGWDRIYGKKKPRIIRSNPLNSSITREQARDAARVKV